MRPLSASNRYNRNFQLYVYIKISSAHSTLIPSAIVFLIRARETSPMKRTRLSNCRDSTLSIKQSIWSCHVYQREASLSPFPPFRKTFCFNSTEERNATARRFVRRKKRKRGEDRRGGGKVDLGFHQVKEKNIYMYRPYLHLLFLKGGGAPSQSFAQIKIYMNRKYDTRCKIIEVGLSD